MTFLRTGKTGRVLLAFGSIALVTAGVLPLYFRSNRNLVPATAAPDPIPVIGPDVGAPMIDLIDDRTLLIVGCTALVVAGLIGVLRAVIRARREEASFSCSITHASVTALIRQVGYQSRVTSLTATSCRRRARSRTIPLA
jgi:hypothetical protein